MTAPSPDTTNLTNLLLHNLANLPTPTDPTTSNPPPLTASKPTLLTLHALYPTTLLPALDVLDRRLITRLDLPAPSSPAQPPHTATRSIYHVRSAAPSSRRPGREPLETVSYEVRTTAWSCTCAAFAFAAFVQPGRGDGGADDPFGGGDEMMDGGGCVGDGTLAGGMDGPAGEEEGGGGGGQQTDGDGDGKGWGGLMRVYGGGGHMSAGSGMGVPICKHLLACVLAEWWDGAAEMVEVRVVEKGEMAGWAGGWAG